MDPNRTRISLSLEVPYEAKYFALYGGDDGARTRDLCRDSLPGSRFTTTYNTARATQILVKSSKTEQNVDRIVDRIWCGKRPNLCFPEDEGSAE